MANLVPDKSFYPTPKMAMLATPEKLAYVALLAAKTDGSSDALGVVDLDPASKTYGALVSRVDMLHAGDSCTILAGTLAVPASARTRRTRTWSVGT